MPVLGICRGMEMLNVIQGGTLNQHLPAWSSTGTRPGVFTDHGVRLEPGSLAERVVGAEHTEVKSAHHQGLEELGEGVVASGYADDGVVEAIELPGPELRRRRALAPGGGRAQPGGRRARGRGARSHEGGQRQ